MYKFNYKWLLSLLALVCWGLNGQAQANDLCAGAFPISSGQTISGTTVGATVDSPSGLTTCGTSITAPGVWYFIVGNGGPLTASTCNQATYDTKISIFSGTCGTLACEGGNDDGAGCSGFTSEASVNTTPGTLYYILVHGFLSTSGSFDLTATLGAPPTGNDVCGGALPIVPGQTISSTTVGTTFDNVGTCNTTNTSPGVWYTTVGNGDLYTATTCGATTFDTKISVFEGNCGNLLCVDGNDDDCGLQSTVNWTSTPGTQYFILVHGFGTSSGTFDLGLTSIPSATNDDPCSAIALNFGDNNYAHIGLTGDSLEVNPGAGSGASSCTSTDGWCSFELSVDNSAWFTFVAPAGGSVNVVGDGFDSQIAVYTASNCSDYSTFVEVGGNDDSGDDFLATANIFSGGLNLNCLTPGQTYYVQVDGFNGAESVTANVNLADNGGTLVSVDAGDCQSHYVGYAPVMGDSNFLSGSASGGVAPFEFAWSVVSGDSTIFFQSDDSASSTIAVQPNQTSVYEVTVTDANGCTSTDQVTVEVVNVACFNGAQMCYSPSNAGTAIVLDWDTDGMGNALPAGTPITNQYANFGINISTDNNNGPDFAAIFDSSNPTGGDTDLGTPNQAFGGPGIGSGGGMGAGANMAALGNILIIQERSQMCGSVFCTPDDDADGGVVTFTFDDPMTVETIIIVDADDGNPSGAVVTIDANTGSYTLLFPSQGNNSVITLPIFEDGVLSMDISFQGSGAIGAVNLRSEDVTFCSPTNDVAGFLARPGYHLGTCNDVCLASNPSVTPPPTCVDLIVEVTTDDFASETSWEIIERGTGTVIGTRQFTFTDDFTTFADTFCVDPTNCYDVNIIDAFGDGICCTFGNGTWNVTFDGVNTVSPLAGAYGAGETISVGNCTNKGSQPESFVAANDLKVAVYPNPSSELTYFKFSAPVAGDIKVDVYNLQGTQMATVFNGQVEADVAHTVDFNATELASGVYIYRVTSNGLTKSGKFQIAH